MNAGTRTKTDDRSSLTLAVARRTDLFMIVDGDRPLDGGARYSLNEIDTVAFGRGEGAATRERSGAKTQLAVTVQNDHVSKAHAVLRRVSAGWLLVDGGSKNGTFLNGPRTTGPTPVRTRPRPNPRGHDQNDATRDDDHCCGCKNPLFCASMTDRWDVAPTLGVPDVLEAVEFFCEKLGFSRPSRLYGPPYAPVYAVVSRGNVSIHLQIRRRALFAGPREDHEGDAYFRVANADALREEFLAKGVRVHRDIQDEPYRLRDFTIETPQGHRLTFGSPL